MPTLGELSKTCEEKPWETPHMDAAQSDDYPKQIVLTRANMLYVPLASLSAKCVNVFKRIAAFRNPEFYEKQGMRLSTYNIPRIISCSEMTDDYLVLPRGCEDAVCGILTQHGVKVSKSQTKQIMGIISMLHSEDLFGKNSKMQWKHLLDII